VASAIGYNYAEYRTAIGGIMSANAARNVIKVRLGNNNGHGGSGSAVAVVVLSDSFRLLSIVP
jgi:hypothetical protein